jgi:hypothetical protein
MIPSPPPSSPASPSRTEATRPADRVVVRVPKPSGAVAAFGSVWVESEPKGSVWRIAPSGRVLARIDGVSRSSRSFFETPQTLERGFGSVWTFTRRAVVRIDPTTNGAVARIPVDSPVSLVVGLGAVWVAAGRSAITLWRIEPSDNGASIVRRMGTTTAGLGVALGRIWWINASEASSVSSVDPSSGRERYVQTPFYVSFIVPGPEGMWLIDRGGQVARIPPGSSQPTKRHRVVPDVLGADRSGDTIWLNTGDVVGLNATTGKTTMSASLVGSLSHQAFAGVAQLGHRVWVVNISKQRIVGVSLRAMSG